MLPAAEDLNQCGSPSSPSDWCEMANVARQKWMAAHSAAMLALSVE